jgi:ribosomal protein L40E
LGEEEAAEVKQFGASRDWFQRFQKRYGFENVNIQGEEASAHVEAADAFLAELKRIIEKGGYSSKQVFNADETGRPLYETHALSDIHFQERKICSRFQAFKGPSNSACRWKCHWQQKKLISALKSYYLRRSSKIYFRKLI